MELNSRVALKPITHSSEAGCIVFTVRCKKEKCLTVTDYAICFTKKTQMRFVMFVTFILRVGM